MHAKAIKKHQKPVVEVQHQPVVAENVDQDNEQFIGEVIDLKSNMAHNAQVRREEWTRKI